MVEPLPLGIIDADSVEVIRPEFSSLVDPGARVTRLWTGGVWVEGPAWLPQPGALIWSDIPNNRMLAWREADGSVTSFRAPSSGGNGNTTDREGRLVTCEQYTRRITRTEHDGHVTILVDRFDGKRFNAPNDIVEKSDGTIWFTDPDYGRSPLYQGERELSGCHVYRFDPASRGIHQVTTDMVMPNGLAFSPDESLLYVVDTGSTHIKGGPNHLRRFSVAADGTLSGGEVIAVDPNEQFDGLRVDTAGNLWMGAGDGVRVYNPDGQLLGRLRVPERVSNLTFGGRGRDRLMMTGTTSIYSCQVKARPAAN